MASSEHRPAGRTRWTSFVAETDRPRVRGLHEGNPAHPGPDAAGRGRARLHRAVGAAMTAPVANRLLNPHASGVQP